MDIFIDNKAIDFTIENENTIGQLLGEIEKLCENAGMTITGIQINGASVAAEDLDEIFLKPLTAVQRIDLETISGVEIRHMMNSLGTAFLSHAHMLREIPVKLQTGNDLFVMEGINHFSRDLQNIYRIIPLLHLTGLEETDLMIEGEPLNTLPERLSPLLHDLLEGLKTGDTVLVGDISEYELAPRIENLSGILSAMPSTGNGMR